MGIAIAAIAEDNNAEIVSACDVGDNPNANIDNCEAIIEFSSHEVTLNIAQLAVEKNIPLVIGTTGHTAKEKAAILSTVEGKIPVIWAGNYSVGVNTLNYLTRKAAGILGEYYEPEVMEMHHHDKKDAPSGTAERLIEILKDGYKLNEEQVVHGREGIVGGETPWRDRRACTARWRHRGRAYGLLLWRRRTN